MPTPTARILVWNAERKSPRGIVGARIPAFLARHTPDIILLTEGELGLMPPGGHTITARPLPASYLRPPERRALAWSREPWSGVEDYAHLEAHRLPGSGDPEHPAATLPGRLVSGTTTTALGPIRVHALCIPWNFSRVRWSDVKRRPWQDHLAFLDALAPILANTPADAPANTPVIVGGDFNQRVPRTAGYPITPAERLAQVFAPPWTIVTAGVTAPTEPASAAHPDGAPAPLIDHLAVNATLAPANTPAALETFGPHDHDGRRLSDHTGCVVTLVRA